MRTPPVRRGVPALAALAVLVAAPFAAAAPVPRLVVRVEDPVAEAQARVRIVIPVSGAGVLDVKYRALPGRPCARTAARDPGTRLHGAWPLTGPVVAERTYAFPAAGRVRVCAWFRRGTRGPGLRGGAEVAVASPDGALRLAVPAFLRPGADARILVAGEAPVPRRAYVRVRPTGASGCGPTYVATPGDGLLQNTPVVGDFRRVVTWTPPRRGRWLVCAWLARGGEDPRGVAADGVISVGVRPPAPDTAVRLDIGDGGPPYTVVANLSSAAGTPRGRCVADVRIPAGWDRVTAVSVADDGTCTVRIPAAAGQGVVVRIRFLPARDRWRPVTASVAIPAA